MSAEVHFSVVVTPADQTAQNIDHQDTADTVTSIASDTTPTTPEYSVIAIIAIIIALSFLQSRYPLRNPKNGYPSIEQASLFKLQSGQLSDKYVKVADEADQILLNFLNNIAYFIITHFKIHFYG